MNTEVKVWYHVQRSKHATYVYLTEAVYPAGAVKRTIEIEEGLNLDFDGEGNLIGIEHLR